ncbi:MAG: NAD(P)H-dependent oxidoreductase subunit E [Sneathiella sp.]|nr:NAD(P)H-dependent oxidoreductase subunit E [Sneathiella sp.]
MELSKKLIEQIQLVAENYPNRRSAIMPALYLAQNRYDCLHGEVLKGIANVLEIPEIWVFELATFYTMYNTEPMGKYHIQLCTNIPCQLRKADILKRFLEDRLHIKTGETTLDGKFTLSTVECIGSCDKAPALMINQDYHEHLDENRVGEILDQLNE